MTYKYYKSSGNSDYIYRVDENNNYWAYPITKESKQRSILRYGKPIWYKGSAKWSYNGRYNNISIQELTEKDLFIMML